MFGGPSLGERLGGPPGDMFIRPWGDIGDIRGLGGPVTDPGGPPKPLKPNPD